MPANKKHFITMLSALFALCFLFSPTIAHAKGVTVPAKSTMTVELQQTVVQDVAKTASVAQTGDLFSWIFLAVLVLTAGFAYITFKSMALAGRLASDSAFRGKKSVTRKMIAVGISSLLLAGTFACAYATKSFADETEFDPKVTFTSHVLVNDQGMLVSSEIIVTSERATATTVLQLDAPEVFDGWNASVEGQIIQPNSELKGEWQGEKVPDDVLKELKGGNGKIELECSTEVSFDVTYDLTEVEVVADTEGQVYSATQKTPKVQVKGLVEGEDFEVEYGENVNAGEDAGTIKVKGIGFWDGEQTVNFDILKKPITVEWSDLTHSYDKTSYTPTATAKDLCDGDSVSVTVSGEQINAGTYEAIATIDDANYEFAIEQKASFTIDKKSITANVEATVARKTYNAKTDATITSAKVTFNALEKDDNLTLKSCTSEFADKNVGENKPVTLTDFVFEGDCLSNYDITSVTHDECKATITAKEVTVSGVSAEERVYAEGDSSVTLTGTAVFGTNDIFIGDTVTIGTVTGVYADADAADGKDVTLTIPLSGADAGNYSVATTSKTIKGNILSILKFEPNAEVTSAILDKNPHYDTTIIDDVATKLVTKQGVKFDGWYDNIACSGAKWDFAKNKISENITTLYANWVPDSTTENKYWLAPAMKTTTANTSDEANVVNPNYSSPINNVKKTATEIQADVKKINEGDESTIAEYKNYMTNDNIHLYTKYGSGNGTSEDDYAEFRIIEVSGATGHETSTGGGDGSVITFMATHTLPIISKMVESTNSEGWPSSIVYPQFQPNTGVIFNTFKSGFTDDVVDVKKEWVHGNTFSQTETPTISADRLWLLSYSEMIDGSASSYFSEASKNEGMRYEWFKDLEIVAGNNNPALTYLTRSGANPSGELGNAYWWLRSSNIRAFTYALTVNSDGLVRDGNGRLEYSNAIVPCFSFGVNRTVKFDNQGHGNVVSTQYDEVGDRVTEPSASEIGTVEGLTFEGWYTDSKCSPSKKWDFSTNTVSGHMTLYANWVVNAEESAYWMAPAMGSSNYVNETQNVLKTASEIQADVAKLQEGDATVTAEYEGYMNNNSHHLYTKWNGSGNTGKNAYAEFQIISVGKHYNIEDDETSADGSCISFMASYLLPGSYQMRSGGTNNGGWPSADTTLRVRMNEGGDIYNSFDSKFTSDIKPTTKRSQTTLSSVSPTQWGTSEDKFWVVSYKEYTGHDNDNCTGEGLGYSNVPGSVMRTRTGSINGWWLRTIKPDTPSWCFTTDGGAPGYFQSSSVNWGVAPCFSFGTVYKVDKTKMQSVLKDLDTKPTSIKFVKGNDSAVSSLDSVSSDGIQTSGSNVGRINVYQSDDTSTVYIAPADKTDLKSMIYAPADSSNLFAGDSDGTNLGEALTSIDLGNLNTSHVTNMSSMFFHNTKITSLNVSGFDTGNVTNFNAMFNECSGLISLDVSKFNTKNSTTLSYMFRNCSSLTALNVSAFTVDSAVDTQYMFFGCSGLTSLDVGKGLKSNNAENMFRDCSAVTSLDVSKLDTSAVGNMYGMFNGCKALTTLTFGDSFKTTNLTNMRYIFYGCNSLGSLDLTNFDTTKCQDEEGWQQTFDYCYKLEKVTLGPNFKFYTTYSSGYLPEQSSDDIEGATGYWYDTETTDSYTPAALATFHNNLNATRTYTASPVYRIDTDKMQGTLKTLSSNNPTTLKFVTGNEVPEGLSSEGSIQATGYGTIGVYLSTDSSTVYIAPEGKNDKVMFMSPRAIDFLRGDITGLQKLVKTVDLSNLDTSKADTMNGMFYELESLETIVFGDNFDSSNVHSFYTMFEFCKSLKTLDVSKFDTANATDMGFMFARCDSLTTIIVSDTFVLDKVTSSLKMFLDSTKLVGGAGTSYDASVIDATRAVVDQGTLRPGYFTAAK